jgi:uncharacterized membrane protein YjjB (DUF3815 family)
MSQMDMIQVLSSFVGSLGFAIVLKIRGKQLIYAGVGGALTWFVYLMAYGYLQSYFWGNLAAAFFVAVYAEIMARVNKAPATIFLTASAVPLIPGANLYKMMFAIVSQDSVTATQNGTTALVIALAISLGFVAVAVINRYLNRLKYFAKDRF